MSVHVCKCEHNGRTEYHLRYPGMTEKEAQDWADKINGGAPYIQPQAQAQALPDEREAFEALEKIAEWNSHDPMLGVDHGSNGVRDFYRQIARAALAAKQERKPMSDDEILSLSSDCYDGQTNPLILFARAIEAGHGIVEKGVE